MRYQRELRLALSLTITTLGYWALAQLARSYFAPDGVVGIYWPAAGWAMAMVLRHGRIQAWGVFAGAILATTTSGHSLLAGLLGGAAASAAAVIGHAWLTREPHFDPQGSSISGYVRLITQSAAGASLASALIGALSLAATGMVALTDLPTSILRWWCGDALGILTVTPLMLAWSPRSPRRADSRVLETGLVLLLAAVMGQIVFLGWHADLFSGIPRRGYWLFPTLIWAAMRLDLRSVSLIILITTVQAMLGIHDNVGYFANASTGAQLIDGWFYLAVVAVTGMLLATSFDERRRTEDALRIAGIAFECQEGIIVVDPDLRIVRTNRSFSRITGYTAEEVQGRTTSFMHSDRHPPSYYENAWRTVRERGSWADEVWHRRKDGEVFPQWLTATAVTDDMGITTHFVLTHTDLTPLRKKEAEQHAREIAQRDALIREVHHRIKNSLQGITGVLRQFSRDHPETTGVISHAISLVKSIAVLHGLQGRASKDVADAVRLEELLKSIVEDVRAVWKTPITLDQPAPLASFKIAGPETVPVAMVLSELLVNAIKHGGQHSGHVGVTLSAGDAPDAMRISISNEGRLPARDGDTDPGGLTLVHAMMPRWGAQLSIQQLGEYVVTQLQLSPPVVTPERRESHADR